MSETERSLRVDIEAQLRSTTHLLDQCLTEAHRAFELAKSARRNVEAFLWKPFPAETPERYGRFIVTYARGKSREGVAQYTVAILNWNGVNWQSWDDYGMPTLMTNDVTAFMELPLPYEKGEINGR